ncbi:MAG: dTMP kinase [bacterium]|nr:dTMP kinase [bacterium]
MKLKKKNGFFITFEGPDGGGKSTHIKLLAEFLKKKGYSVVLTREPGGTALGEDIRDVLLDPRIKNLSLWSELFLYLSCRSQILEEVIKPALRSQKIVLCDRFTDATVAYQGFGRKIDIDLIKNLNGLLVGEFKPDLTVLIDIEPETGLERSCVRGGKVDRIEKEKIAFHRRVRNGYLDLSKKESKRFLVVAGGDSLEKNKAIIQKGVLKRIKDVLG